MIIFFLERLPLDPGVPFPYEVPFRLTRRASDKAAMDSACNSSATLPRRPFPCHLKEAVVSKRCLGLLLHILYRYIPDFPCFPRDILTLVAPHVTS
jgi:hypothetical protein